MNIVLCGMMGAGKTAVGEALSRLSGRKAVDTDALIEEKYGRITDIFAAHGEAYFRDLETETARRLAEEDGLVIATGGGFVLREENCALLKRKGKIFFLRARLQTLLARLEGDSSRPLLAGGAEKKLRELLPVRTPVYERAADHVVDTDGRTPEDIAREILSRLLSDGAPSGR